MKNRRMAYHVEDLTQAQDMHTGGRTELDQTSHCREEEVSQTRHMKNTMTRMTFGTHSLLPVHPEALSGFIISVNLLDNFKLPPALRLYNGTSDTNTHVIMFKFMMPLNRATDHCFC